MMRMCDKCDLVETMRIVYNQLVDRYVKAETGRLEVKRSGHLNPGVRTEGKRMKMNFQELVDQHNTLVLKESQDLVNLQNERLEYERIRNDRDYWVREYSKYPYLTGTAEV